MPGLNIITMKNNIAIESSPLEDDLTEQLRHYISHILTERGIESSTLNIVFIDEKSMHQMNREYRNRDMPTDVITFSMLEGQCTEFSGNMLGDIYICPVCIPDVGKRAIVRRIFHGIIHILGYMHETDAENGIFMKMENIMITDFFGGIND